MKKHILIPLARGVTGFLFWQYRPERIGLESPAWGLTDLKGNSTAWLEQAKTIHNALHKQQDSLLASAPIPAKVAILNSGASQIFTWCISGEIELYYDSVKGLFDAMYEGNIAVDILSEHQLNSKDLSRYQCLLAPCPYYMTAEQAEEIRTWVASGGTLISEALFGSVDSRTNLHAVESPGYGFAEVFGAYEKQVLTASHFKNAYGSQWAEENSENIFSIHSQQSEVKGYHYRQELVATTAKPIAYFDAVEKEESCVAATVNTYGKGKALLLGSLIGKAYSATKHPSTKDFLCNLVQTYASVHPVAQSNGRVDFLLQPEKAAFVIVQNKSDEQVIVTSSYLQTARKLKNIINESEVEVKDNTVELTVALKGIEIFKVID